MNHLSTPRFEVIANYPFQKIDVGTILNMVHFKFHKIEPEKYPHLFKKLEWWKNRTQDEMPKYVKLNSTVHKVDDWKMNYQNVRIANIYEKEITLVMSQHDFKPATEQEYSDYINSL